MNELLVLAKQRPTREIKSRIFCLSVCLARPGRDIYPILHCLIFFEIAFGVQQGCVGNLFFSGNYIQQYPGYRLSHSEFSLFQEPNTLITECSIFLNNRPNCLVIEADCSFIKATETSSITDLRLSRYYCILYLICFITKLKKIVQSYLNNRMFEYRNNRKLILST